MASSKVQVAAKHDDSEYTFATQKNDNEPLASHNTENPHFKLVITDSAAKVIINV